MGDVDGGLGREVERLAVRPLQRGQRFHQLRRVTWVTDEVVVHEEQPIPAERDHPL